MDRPVRKVEPITTICPIRSSVLIVTVGAAGLVNNNLARAANPPEAFSKFFRNPADQHIQGRLPLSPNLLDRTLNFLHSISSILHPFPQGLNLLCSPLKLLHHPLAPPLRYLQFRLLTINIRLELLCSQLPVSNLLQHLDQAQITLLLEPL